jgi:hypothetical protein
MAKPRNRPDVVNSDFFTGVTPLWVGPGRAPIPERFHAASFSLADWATSRLPRNSDQNWSVSESGFWPLRHFLIEATERWHSYDWKADEDLIASRKRDEKHQETLAKATRAFRQALGKSAFRRAERDLGVSIVAALSPEARIEMTYEDGCNAVANALRELESRAGRPNHQPVRYGPLIYKALPQRLPKPEVAVALVLADWVTQFRRDSYRAGDGSFPRAPLLSPELPWTAITLFATAFSDDPQAQFDHRKIASSVKNLRGKVMQIMSKP